MTNDEWIALLDRLPPGERSDVVRHAIEAQTSVMVASNALHERIEHALNGYAHQVGAVVAKQDLITEFLQRIDAKLDKQEQRMTALERRMSASERDRKQINKRLAHIEKQLGGV